MLFLFYIVELLVWHYFAGFLKALSINDVRREITFCKKTGIKICGIIENMSGFICPNCSVKLNG